MVEAQRALDELLITRTDSHPDVILARKHLEEVKASVAKEAAELRLGGRRREVRGDRRAAKILRRQNRRAKAEANGKPDGDSAAPPLKPGAKGSKPDAEAQKLPPGSRTKCRTRFTNSSRCACSKPNRRSPRCSASSPTPPMSATGMDEMARSAPGLQAEYINLNRDYDVLQSNYKELLARREEMRIARGRRRQRRQDQDPGDRPAAGAAEPGGAEAVADAVSAVLAIGVAGGAALAVLLVQFDQSFHTIDELRDLGLPVAGGISLLNVAVTRGRLASAFAFGMALVLLGGLYARPPVPLGSHPGYRLTMTQQNPSHLVERVAERLRGVGGLVGSRIAAWARGAPTGLVGRRAAARAAPRSAPPASPRRRVSR